MNKIEFIDNIEFLNQNENPSQNQERIMKLTNVKNVEEEEKFTTFDAIPNLEDNSQMISSKSQAKEEESKEIIPQNEISSENFSKIESKVIESEVHFNDPQINKLKWDDWDEDEPKSQIRPYNPTEKVGLEANLTKNENLSPKIEAKNDLTHNKVSNSGWDSWDSD